MSLKPKASRQEKQVRNIQKGFGLAGIILLAISMTMAGTFGWGLGHDLTGKIGYAVFFTVADFVGALLMASIGILFAWRWWGIGSLVALALVCCVSFSMLSVFGFQAGNRGAVSRSYDDVQKRAEKRLDWLRGMTTDKSFSKDRDKLMQEEREQYKEYQRQIEPDPDAQASDLAKILGLEKDQTQRGLSLIGSGVILLLQFICLSLRSFFRHRVEPVIAAHIMSEAVVNTSDTTSKLSVNFDKIRAAARSQIVQILVTGAPFPRNKALAREWGVSQPTVSNWLRAWKEEGLEIPFRGKGKRRLRLIKGGGAA